MTNGKYCESGLAYPISKNEGKCTSFKEMRYNDTIIEDPFPCNASYQNYSCELYFNIDAEDIAYSNQTTRRFVENQCKCALTGNETLGYCSSVLGTKKYRRAVAALRLVKEASNCHTIDRDNFLA